MKEIAPHLNQNQRAVALVRCLIARANVRHRAGLAMVIAMMGVISTRSVVSVFISIVRRSRTMRVTALPIRPVAPIESFERVAGLFENFGNQTGESLRLKLNLG